MKKNLFFRFYDRKKLDYKLIYDLEKLSSREERYKKKAWQGRNRDNIIGLLSLGRNKKVKLKLDKYPVDSRHKSALRVGLYQFFSLYVPVSLILEKKEEEEKRKKLFQTKNSKKIIYMRGSILSFSTNKG